ncbi:hypothetical protein JAAARDRAFT_601244 [Jaapia argillacea MUCL 33604]|uniref:Uncharacterized protein n=1 Tax=Jaapia argillacea MUCL 33604 TaxID=933084 RepID=A0A067Q9S5_9AGAM|nr:hypothetical protein JAAARDRAFT_601244 [Jaapia argillacea MUCL 33604]
MPRSVYLLVYHSPLFPAHWGLFIPYPVSLLHPSTATVPDDEGSPSQKTAIGKVIHVHGDSFNGFAHQFKRNYEHDTTQRAHSLVWLCEVGDEWVGDGEDEKGDERELKLDVEPVDEIERRALSVPAPGPSLKHAGNLGGGKKVEIKNCQTWLRDFVQVLVEEGIFPSSALAALDAAPKN